MTDLEVQTARPAAVTETTPWALDKLPPFPMVATRLIRMLGQVDVDITEIGKMISAEPVFASRVLQMANSPLFALERQVKTISHAIIILGLARLKAITVTRAVGDFVAPALRFKALRVCWRNSLAGALLAEKLAPACKIDPDFAYVGGLLRDIGRLALLVKYPESYTNLLAVTRENDFDLRATERDLFDIDHCEAGAWLMARTPFPTELSEAVSGHHDAVIDPPFRMVHLVRVADQLADALGFGVLTSGGPRTMAEVISDLPVSFRDRVELDEAELKNDIESRIQTWN